MYALLTILRCFIFPGKLFYADQLSDHFQELSSNYIKRKFN